MLPSARKATCTYLSKTLRWHCCIGKPEAPPSQARSKTFSGEPCCLEVHERANMLPGWSRVDSRLCCRTGGVRGICPVVLMMRYDGLWSLFKKSQEARRDEAAKMSTGLSANYTQGALRDGSSSSKRLRLLGCDTNTSRYQRLPFMFYSLEHRLSQVAYPVATSSYARSFAFMFFHSQYPTSDHHCSLQ